MSAKKTPKRQIRRRKSVTKQEAPTEPTLTAKEQAFLEYYLECFNGAEAARRAGYSKASARQIAHRLLTKAYIRAAIDKRLGELAMGSDEVLARLTYQARGDVSPFLKRVGQRVVVDLTTPEARLHLGLLKEVRVKERTGGHAEEAWTEVETELKLHDPQAALGLLGRHYKLFTDKVEHSGPGGGPIPFSEVVIELPPADPPGEEPPALDPAVSADEHLAS